MHISVVTALLEFGKKYEIKQIQDEAEVNYSLEVFSRR
jgi:hypothetical protein